jgi:hypothetical protein
VALTILEFDDSSPLVSKSASAATGTYRNNHTTVGTSGLQPLYTPASGKQAAILTDANLLMSTFTPTSDLGLNYSQNSAGASGTYWVAIYPSGTIAANTTPYYASASAPNLTNSASTAQRIVLSHGVITDGYEMGLNVVSGSITSSNPFFWVNVVETDIT